MTLELPSHRITQSEFSPACWLKNRHLQTLYPSFPWSWPARPELRRATLELPDGDATAVDWLVAADSLPDTAPLLVILHGLEGSAASSYARMLMEAALARGWRSCVLHFRDCGDYRNRLPRRYHAGETNDLRYFLDEFQAQRHSSGNTAPIFAVGYSLGGNVLLKYLGEAADKTPITAAVGVCVPLNLHECSKALNIGFSKLYQTFLLKRMKKAVASKFDRYTAAFDWDRAMSASTFEKFDDAVTAPLHGFDGMQDYYDRCSSVNFLSTIKRPTLIVNALDDPFMTPDVIPSAEALSEAVTLEVANYGGHVGFIDGGTPWRPTFFLPTRIMTFLDPFLATPAP